MGKTMIKKDLFPEIVNRYNKDGKSAAYDYLRSRYGIKNPYFVMTRIRACGKYIYDPESDRFTETGISRADDVFMNLDELCGATVATVNNPVSEPVADRTMAMEKLVHELLSDRLLTLSKYITLDSSTRSILIDQTSLASDEYRIVTH